MKKLEEILPGKTVEELRLFIGVTDLYGQMYVVRDLTERINQRDRDGENGISLSERPPILSEEGFFPSPLPRLLAYEHRQMRGGGVDMKNGG